MLLTDSLWDVDTTNMHGLTVEVINMQLVYGSSVPRYECFAFTHASLTEMFMFPFTFEPSF